MTVAELIERLRAMPQDATVVVDYDSALEIVVEARARTVEQEYLRNRNDWPDKQQIVVELAYTPVGLVDHDDDLAQPEKGV